jgi:hypothetical protein
LGWMIPCQTFARRSTAGCTPKAEICVCCFISIDLEQVAATTRRITRVGASQIDIDHLAPFGEIVFPSCLIRSGDPCIIDEDIDPGP